MAAPPTIEDRLGQAIGRYETRTLKSKILHDQATHSLPGGNTRTLLFTSPWPISIKRGQGYQVFDEDDHVYTDLTGEMSAGLYGHSNPVILAAITSTLHQVGLSLGGTTAQEAKFAELLCSRFGLEHVRFANSGTEANLHALAAARRHTGRRKVVVFNGGYHGAVLSFGHGVAVNTVDPHDWIVAKYNDVASAQEAIEGNADVAAVIVEAMQGSGGCIPATKEFLMAVQESAKKMDAVFILDEVMTSRLAPGGLQSAFGLSPDLKTFGKYLGGGLAFGCFGGSGKVMSVYDPRLGNSLAHSGTFNNNTLAMHAGYAGLANVYTPEVCEAFTASGNQLLERLQHVSRGTKCSWTGVGTLISSHFTKNKVQATDILSGDDLNEDTELRDLFWYELLEEGFWVTKRGMLALVLDTPQHELDRFVDSVSAFLSRHSAIVGIAE